MPISLVSPEQITAVNKLLTKKWDHGGHHSTIEKALHDLPMPPTPDNMTPEHYSRSIAVSISTMEDATPNYRQAQFIISTGTNVEVWVLFFNLAIFFVDEEWFPNPDESFLLRMRPCFETAEEAFEWIKSGAFMLFMSTTDSVLVVNGDYQLEDEWSLADDFKRAQDPEAEEQLNIHLDCAAQIARETTATERIQALRDDVKALAGISPDEAMRSHFKELLARELAEPNSNKKPRWKTKKARKA
jgi:hypothetical protein